MRPVVLICDDNYAIHESLRSFLSAEKIDTVSAYNGKDALTLVQNTGIDLVILDIMLPDFSGIDVCREIRRKSDVPVIMLSALGSETDRIHGLQIGADDYVTKPFSPLEVATRVRSILRRASVQQKRHVLRFAELTVDADAFLAYVDGEKAALTPNEVKMLAYFIENAGVVLSRERLLNAIWGYDYCGDSRAVDAQITRLRKKLPSEHVHFRIQSVYGIGYRLEEVQ